LTAPHFSSDPNTAASKTAGGGRGRLPPPWVTLNPRSRSCRPSGHEYTYPSHPCTQVSMCSHRPQRLGRSSGFPVALHVLLGLDYDFRSGRGKRPVFVHNLTGRWSLPSDRAQPFQALLRAVQEVSSFEDGERLRPSVRRIPAQRCPEDLDRRLRSRARSGPP